MEYYSKGTGTWGGSVLIVTDISKSSPALVVEGKARHFELFDTYEHSQFWRADFQVQLSNRTQNIRYSVQGSSPEYTVILPGSEEVWHWCFYSCNGFSSDVKDYNAAGGFEPMWRDLFRVHRERPFHALVGGGDQLYMDLLFEECGRIVNWLDSGNRNTQPFDINISNAVHSFYFETYMKHFNQEPYKTALATIPSVMAIDDHDIFDGYGSYPPDLQNCPVIKGIGQVAKRFYLLFQQHTTENRAHKEHGYVGLNGFNKLYSFGNDTSLLTVDGRWERSREQVVSAESWRQIFSALDHGLDRGVRHLVVVLAIPIVYPRMNASEVTLESLESLQYNSSAFKNLTNLVQKAGAFKTVVSHFNLPELLDDLLDHWTCKQHSEERKYIVENLQRIAAAKQVRVTFISGDVHCCSAGKFFNPQKRSDERDDSNCMYQITSSAIVNAPPPNPVLFLLENNSKEYVLNNETNEIMLDLFTKDVNGEPRTGTKFINRRNWCEVSDLGNGRRSYSLHVESVNRTDPSVEYKVNVPLVQFA
jgi:hypothetical protein